MPARSTEGPSARKPPARLALPPKPTRPPRDELARDIASMRDVADLVRELRSGLAISQSTLAARADVGRHWLIALEQGQPTLEAGKVFRVLETLGFELVATPTTRRRPGCCAPAPPPPRRARPPPPRSGRAGPAAGHSRASGGSARTSRRGGRFWSEGMASQAVSAHLKS